MCGYQGGCKNRESCHILHHRGHTGQSSRTNTHGRKIKETHCGCNRSSIKTDRKGIGIPPPVWYLIYYNIKANDNGRKLNFNTAPAAASIVRTYPVRPQRWRQCRRTALHAPCNKNIPRAFCRFAGAAPHSGPGPVTDTQLPSLTTPACCNYAVNRRI